MRTRSAVRAAAVTAVAAIATGVGLVNPSWACGCGAFVVKDASFAVRGETAIVRWNGERENVVMRLAVQSQAPEAAWILPTPSRATVELAEARWFEELEALTRPRVVTTHDWWPPFTLPWGDAYAGAPAAGAPVLVLDEQRIGPFQVATLAVEHHEEGVYVLGVLPGGWAIVFAVSLVAVGALASAVVVGRRRLASER